MTAERPIRIHLSDERSVSGLWTGDPSSTSWTFVYAPGAGASLTDGFGVFAAQYLAERDLALLRFQFPYMEEGRRLPDRPPVLEVTWRAAIAVARERSSRLVIGGRSMGGRMASQVVAAGEPVEALALFAYPLHPPGRPDKPRNAHLSKISIATFFCSGTHDTFATPDELRTAAALVPNSTVHLLDSADHPFKVPKRSGRTQVQVWTEALDAFVNWLQSLSQHRPQHN
jgi:uncharacterized protein